MIRKPAVAGQFYHSSPELLRTQIRKYIEDIPQKEEAIGIVAPHAGYMYSGRVAGAVYSRIAIPDLVVILGPNHTGRGRPCSLMVRGTWQMPLGDVPLSSPLAKAILESSKDLEEDVEAHTYEHSLEVQVPFLQYFNVNFQLVPIVLWRENLATLRDIGRAIAQGIKSIKKKVLIVASTDMTHYEPQEAAQRKDREALDSILKLDEEELIRKVKDLDISMCGYAPTVAMLVACKVLGAKEAKLVLYMTSGDVTKDYGQVVGYAGVLVK